MQSNVRLGEAAHVLVGVGISSLVVLAIAYLVIRLGSSSDSTFRTLFNSFMNPRDPPFIGGLG